MKPIAVTEEFKTQAQEAFLKALESYKPSDGALNFKMSPSAVDTSAVTKPTILITADAYAKMMGLVYGYKEEICWHGLVERLSPSEFRIYDILCYPQINASTTVEMDDDKYIQWWMALEDDQVNAMHFQGHSHVKMAVNPSGTDTNNWNDFLDNTTADGYYIFCIANQHGLINWWIYDLATNWIYEPSDISTAIELEDGTSVNVWAEENIKNYTSKRSVQKYSALGSTFDNIYDTAWDETYDDAELLTSETYRPGYRWSYLRKAYACVINSKNSKNKNNKGLGNKGGNKR